MAPVNIQGRIFPPVADFCIFCGSDGGEAGLRDEHIIPYSLGGKAVLEKASCRACEKITSYVDGYLARAIFYDHRLNAGVQSRSPPKDRPKTRTAAIMRGDQLEWRDFAAGQHPYTTVLPLLGMPGILVGEPPQPGFRSNVAAAYHYTPPGFKDAINLADGESVKLMARGDINLVAFARGIAKIGYCQAVASGEIFPDKDSAIAGFILGKNQYGSYLVGAEPESDPSPPDKRDLLHWVTVAWERLPTKAVLVASIRLFSNSGTDEEGMPTYLVALAELPNGEPRESALFRPEEP